jgi:hypothetical protein
MSKNNIPRLRTSERSTFKACEFRWYFTYGIGKQVITPAPSLRFGTLIHAALAKYYKKGVKRGPNPAKTFARLYEKELVEQESFGFRDEDGVWTDAAELGERMLENYVEQYGADDKWEVIATEMPFQTTVYHHSTNEPWFEYVGILDGVWRDRSKRQIWIPDHKTTSSLGGSSGHPTTPPHLMMDDQAGAYWSYGVDFLIKKGILKKNQKIAGMLFNIMRKSKGDDRPYKIVNGVRLYLNQDGSVSKRQPPPLFHRQPIFRDEYDRDMARKRAEFDLKRIQIARALLKYGEPPEQILTKSPGMFTCPMCPVRDICELHEVGADYTSMIDSTLHDWSAYEAHEVREGR